MSAIRNDGDVNRVGIVGLSEITDGESVMLRSKLEFFASLSAIDIELIILGPLHRDGALEIRRVVEIETEEPHTTAIAQ